MERLEGQNNALGAYFDTAGLITIGVGFNIDIAANRNIVMAAMNLTAAQIAAVNGAFTPPAGALSAQLVSIRALAPGSVRDTQLRTFLNGLLGTRNFAMTAAEVDNAFATFVTNHSVAAAALIPTLSFERMALVSLDFNNPNFIGSGLRAALALADPFEARAEAWYQIRYAHANQLHKRRYIEAALFGLYGANVLPADSANEALGIYRVYTRHGREMTQSGVAMVDYDAAFANQITGAQADLNTAQLGVIHVEDLRATLDPARDSLVAWLNPQLPAERQLTAADWNSAAIYVAASGSAMHFLDASVDDGRLAGMENNLLIGGSGTDYLTGGAGNDVLVGFDAGDRLTGDAGNDQLYGAMGTTFSRAAKEMTSCTVVPVRTRTSGTRVMATAPSSIRTAGA
jgi:GH24 family phage-related lysozyme (muramidase)